MRLRSRHVRFAVSVVVPSLAVVALTIAVFVVVMTRMADDMNRSAEANTEAMARTALAGNLEQMRRIHIATSGWSGQMPVWSRNAIPERIERMRRETASSEGADVAMLLDEAGSTLSAFRGGAAVRTTAADFFRTGYDALFGLRRMAPWSNYLVGYVATADGPAIVAIGPVRVAPDGADGPAPVRILLFARLLSTDRLGALARSVRGLGVSGAPDDGRGGGGRYVLTASGGTPVGALRWTPNRPGDEALERVRTATAWLALTLLGAAGVLIAACYRHMEASHRGERRAMVAARRDALTGLTNRSAFLDLLEAALAAPGASEVTLLFMDLDGFKSVNDTHGHAAGDRLLAEAARLFEARIAGRGALARLGGDEFAVLLTGRHAGLRGRQVSEDLIEALGALGEIDRQTVRVGVSIGIATDAERSLTTVELMRRADTAMYAAKEFGRNRATVWTPALDRNRIERAELARLLRISIGTAAFHLVYQPIVGADGGRTVGVEALVRWMAPGRGAIPPDVFIPIAEECGLIGRIGDFVLRSALADARDWPDIALSVNMSPAQFHAPDLVETIRGALAEAAFPPHRLTLEITETFLISQPDRSEAVMRQLRGLGVRLALDDFGIGYSSIGYLRRFPFDQVKLDRSFADVEDPTARRVAAATVALADALSLPVTAEGIEDAATGRLMAEAGCDRLQGYAYGRPVPAIEITRRLAAERSDAAGPAAVRPAATVRKELSK